MKAINELVCTAALCLFTTGVYASDQSAALAQAATDYTAAKQECKKMEKGQKRNDCLHQASVDNKKNVANIKVKEKKETADAKATAKKLTEEANAKALKTTEEAEAAKKKAVDEAAAKEKKAADDAAAAKAKAAADEAAKTKK